jgi:hypothetical protein
MRIRTIKPEFFHHEELFELEKETSLPIRIAFAGLWCAADREGRFKWEPRRLGIQILPYDNVEFSRVLHALTTRGFLVKYACGTGVFGAIPSFTRHQVINNKEGASQLPDPFAENSQIIGDSDEFPRVGHACLTRNQREDHACRKEGKGKEGNEGKGEERTGADAPRVRFEKPSVDEVRIEALKIDLPEAQADQFFSYYEANGWKVGRNPMKSWTHALANWKIRSKDFSSSNRQSPAPKGERKEIVEPFVFKEI